MRRVARLIALALCGVGGSCAQVQLYWVHRNEPLPREATLKLGAGQADLQRCLDTLGAPDRVWESPKGMVLSYGWLDQFYWQFDVVLYGTDSSIDGRTLFSYNATNVGFDGAVLVFDNALKLKFVRFGKLNVLTRDLPRRPMYVEDVRR